MNIIDQVKQTLIEEITASVKAAGLAEEVPEVKVEIPKDPKMGITQQTLRWYLLNCKRNPHEIAQAIVDHLDKSKANVEKIEIAGPGFINFYLNNQYLTAVIPEALEKIKTLDVMKTRNIKSIS